LASSLALSDLTRIAVVEMLSTRYFSITRPDHVFSSRAWIAQHNHT
jgi:hypothetical protein